MKGLLLKDIYTIFKQIKVFLILIVIFAFVPSRSSSLYSFSIFYAMILPVNALAFDEKSKWNTLALMMPYSKNELVFSKYLFGYISCFLSTILVAIAQTIVSLIIKAPLTSQFYWGILITFAMALIMEAIYLPLIFRFGVEKGRMALIIVMVVFIVAMSGLSGVAMELILTGDSKISAPVLAGLAVAISAVINTVSVFISKKVAFKERH